MATSKKSPQNQFKDDLARLDGSVRRVERLVYEHDQAHGNVCQDVEDDCRECAFLSVLLDNLLPDVAGRIHKLEVVSPSEQWSSVAEYVHKLDKNYGLLVPDGLKERAEQAKFAGTFVASDTNLTITKDIIEVLNFYADEKAHWISEEREVDLALTTAPLHNPDILNQSKSERTLKYKHYKVRARLRADRGKKARDLLEKLNGQNT